MSPSIAASIVLLAVSLTLFQIRCGAADDNNTASYLQNSYCPTTSAGNSSNSDSLYKKNLDLFLAKLPSNAINNSGFYNGSVGTVSGMAMCLADIPWPDQCDRCLRAASAEAPVVCSSSSNATVLYRGCLLRYADAPIFADDFGDSQLFFDSHGADVPDTAAFGQTRKDLFTALASQAVVSPLMIASGNRTFNSTHRLYGLAQCSRDLPSKLCFHAITSTIEKLPSSVVPWSEGFSFAGFSFYIRYDMTPFTVSLPRHGTSPSQPEAKDVPPTGTGPSQTKTVKGGLVQRVVEVIVIPVAFLIIIILLAFIVRKRWKIGHYQKVAGLKDFPFGDIKSATKNFCKDELLGEGGFGKVYKGTFNIDHNKTELAVKCVTNPSAAKQLMDELKILPKLKHTNVVQLVGFCNNDRWWFQRGRGLYVCNEYISNGSLDKHLAGASLGQSGMEWSIRYQIICGICTGLRYLHQECNSNILHMDLKPGNILLDDEMIPKIADFGLSRTFLNTKTHTYTNKVIGSNGYMAPEFLERGKVGRPCDIYSLGVLILAIVMGQGPTAMRDPGGVTFINKVRDKFIIDLEATTTKLCIAKDREQLKKDASLKLDELIEDVEKCVGLAFECINEEPKNRPTATAISSRLNQVIPSDNQVHISLQVNELQK